MTYTKAALGGSVTRKACALGIAALLVIASLAFRAVIASLPFRTADTAAISSPQPYRLGGSEAPVVLAHYYIWFTPGSWNRAKKDVPLAGRYSSDDAKVMRRHINQARAVGVDGFIVSWKSTPVLNKRLETLISVASEEDFKLAITYQGLDFDRVVLPAPRIADDLDSFVEHYAGNPVFDIFGKPMVVLTGTPVMSRETLAKITKPRRERLLILASEKTVESYERIAEEVDGNLYYWSSVNPKTFDQHAEKLALFGQAVRAHRGIWVAPVAPGFDARMIGGSSSVDRHDGETMRAEWAAASKSRPSAVGVISWNEFSENTHIEPSARYGQKYLDVLSELTGAPHLPALEVGSSEPDDAGTPIRAITALGGVLAVVIMSAIAVVRRHSSYRALGRK